MPTPKSLRSAPDRTFEDYILTLSRGMGLTKIPQEKFYQIPGLAGASGRDDDVSDALDIGFTFSFDGRNHTKFRTSPNGWVILVAPGSTADAGTTINDVMVNTHANSRIKDTFTANHVLCAVWYDDLQSTYSSPVGLGLSSQEIDLYEKGLSQPDARINPRKYGVQYYNDNLSNEGRRLIIRWNSLSYTSTLHSILRFEFVLYENGKIEYRYGEKNTLSPSTSESATVGIFMPGGTWRFRDFSYELGYDQTRSRYNLGGAISGSYTDTSDAYTVPYGVNLKPETYWPSQKNSGAVFTFHPPLNRRKVLPRLSIKERDSRTTLPTIARTGDKDRSGSEGVLFDDRKSIVYKTRNDINYPSMLPRFYASDLPGVMRNQDLFTGEFVFTGSIKPASVQEYLEDNEKKFISPFSEYKLFENDPSASSDSFFTTGSSIKDVGEGFSQPLKSKTQIRLSFRVDHKTTLFGASSSIYYFNSKMGRWQYPTASFQNGEFDIASHFNDGIQKRLTEVDRGFNAFGFNISSGSSSNRSIAPYGTDGYLGGLWYKNDEINSITKEYQKSVQVDQRYSANSDESFLVSIQQPFLLEKAVIELPIEAGPGWFNDKTRCFIPVVSGSGLSGSPTLIPLYSTTTYPNFGFDVGGPGITVALFNQIATSPTKTRRDLILSGTITHHFDNTAEIVYSNSPDICLEGNIWQINPQGFKAYGTPSAVINPIFDGSNYFFTGSVTLKCDSTISNGTLIRDTIYINHSLKVGPTTVLYKDYTTGSLETVFNTEKLKIPRSPGEFFNPISHGGGNIAGIRWRYSSSINNFGRGAAGFQPSGRSILGKEYVTTQGLTDFFDNPFYLYKNDNTLNDLKSIVINNPNDAQWFYATSLINKSTTKVSPYLLLPGDKLVLSVSKSRPYLFSTNVSAPYTSGSIQHDIKLTTGSINITLYGSLVSNGREFHDTLNQQLSSDAIHDVVVGGTKTW